MGSGDDMANQLTATVLDARAVLDAALEAFVTVDVDGRVTGWNPAAERTFGYSRDEAVGRRIDELIIPEAYRAQHRRGLAEVATGGSGRLLGQRLELPACHRDGRTLFIELTLNVVATDDGPQFCGFAHDITERRRAERFRGCELAVAKALADAADTGQAGRAVLEAVATTLDWPYAELWLATPDQQNLVCAARWSAPGRDYAAFAADTLASGLGVPGVAWQTGQPIWLPDLAADTRYPRSAAAAACGLHVTLAVPIHGHTTPLGVLAFFGTAIADPEDMLIALLSGIAAHVGQYLERRRAEELTVQLARAKDEFIALITHELRNPLSVILAYGRMLLDDDSDHADRRALLEAIDRNAANLSTIVNDLLDLARLESGQFSMRMTATDLCAAIRDAAEAARPVATSRQIRLTVDLPDRAPVTGDATRLRQVADNLISNAVKYTPPGGTVTITITCPGDRVRLTVADTGIGIPQTERDRLFQRFYRTPTAMAAGIPGTGLGLVITRTIIENHHGTITLADHPGPGTTFVINLPHHRTADTTR